MSTSLKPVRGRAWLFGDNVDTDQIIQGRYLTLLDYSEMAKHAFEIPRPEFSRNVRKNDIVVAGNNFGGGSSREEAPRVLSQLGVGCVLAQSFARLFYRNAINIGLPVLMIPNVTHSVNDGMTLDVNIIKSAVIIKETGETLSGQPLSRMVLDILQAGGAVAWFRKVKESRK
ncbi:MAG: 3-isopropylmalate dehydratase [Candidatus Thorarchaeota archaeon]|nr:MAG: 3-isopropylmalate dehydratase [Candidatus Thorarchaeota archaeon]